MRKTGILITVLLLLFSIPADCEWLIPGEGDVPEEKGYLVQEYTGTVRITFLGDCTLGGEEKNRNAGNGYFLTVEKN